MDGWIDWLVDWSLLLLCRYIISDKQFRLNMYLRLHIAPTCIWIPRYSEHKSIILVICKMWNIIHYRFHKNIFFFLIFQISLFDNKQWLNKQDEKGQAVLKPIYMYIFTLNVPYKCTLIHLKEDTIYMFRIIE